MTLCRLKSNLSLWTISILLVGAYIFIPSIAIAESNCNIEVPQEGRNAPKYVSMKGYISVGRFWTPKDSKALPPTPWRVPSIVQVGPQLWEDGKRTFENKTPVVVLSQHLKHTGHGFYKGYLVVEIIETAEVVRIRAKNFTPAKYWECSSEKAIKYSPFIAKVDKDILPVNRQDRWENMGKENRVLCVDYRVSNSIISGIECYMYKQYRYGYGGVRHIFPPSSLKIIY